MAKERRVRLLLVLLLSLPALARPSWVDSDKLDSPAVYRALIQKVKPILLRQGAVVDLPQDVPTVILPDLHAQRDYLAQALQLKLKGKTVESQLQAKKINLLCLGDGMHSENRHEARWLQAERELSSGTFSPSMEAEMVESLGLMKKVMELKASYPGHFYFVRGNHEDMDPLIPYRKFTASGESQLVKRWVTARFGAQFVKDWHSFEQALPLVARGASFVGSHSAPESPLTMDALQRRTDEAFRACTWSDNTVWSTAQERNFLKNCELMKVTPARPWIVGHRKVVASLYRIQCGGRLLQINPMDYDARVFILAPAKGSKFDAAEDVRVLRK